MTVGTSVRTVGKHDLLNKLLGREVGVIHRGYTSAGFRRSGIFSSSVIFDLCAGNGIPSEYSKTSSPQIILYHAGYLLRHSREAKVFLFEKDPNTFAKLYSGFSDQAVCILGDSRFISVEKLKELNLDWHKHPFFFHADPNTVSNFPLTAEFLDSIPVNTTGLITLGCNAGGIKRIARDERDKWRQNVLMVCDSIAPHHDAILLTLLNDESQWAYLIVTPTAWVDRVRDDGQKAFKSWPHGVSTDSYRSEFPSFMSRLDYLFLTEKERNNGSARN